MEEVEYIVKRSPRARHVRLQICPRDGLKITVPTRFDDRKLPDIIKQHQPWIERQLSKLPPKTDPDKLPESFYFKALDEIWKINYQLTAVKSIRYWVQENQTITLSGNINDKELVKKILKKWLCLHASTHFLPWLNRISAQTQLPYTHLTTRFAHTRWGSCSSTKRICLNAKLLFLTPDLVEHVMIHELCHTKHLNHSTAFWDLFKSLNNDCLNLRKSLKRLHLTELSGLDS